MSEVLLALDAVSKSYWRGTSEVRVLCDAELSIERGEFIGVWGKRGSGKSTLLRIAAGLETPDCGSVRFEGEDLATLSEADQARLRRDRIALVRRAGPRSELRMLDYVALPLLVQRGRREANRLADRALQRVGMGQVSGQRWESLSDGERAFVAIAHGIARAPRLLLVDDPTANLDVLERDEILQLLRSLVEEAGLAVLMTAPDMPAALGSDQLRALSGGRLIKRPPPPRTDDDNVVDLSGYKRSA
ncbi:MAG: ABC transporter ATP-binding protein [Solirubrobacteraceae bacterium]